MTRFSKTILLMGCAVFALSACSGTKGPGSIGSKEDIVVRNNGLPGGAKAPMPGADVADAGVDATNEALAMPPAMVEEGQPVSAEATQIETTQPLPDSSPAMEQAVQAVQDSKAPVASSASEPMSNPEETIQQTDSAAAIPEKPVTQQNVAPPVQNPGLAPEIQQPVIQQAQPAPVSVEAAPATVAPTEAQSSVYPAADYPSGASAYIPPKTAAQTETAPTPAVTAPAPSPNAYVPLPAGSAYPLDPNAPYSPSAVAVKSAPAVATPASTPTPVTAAVAGLNMADPVLIRSAQAALKVKGGYVGPENGQVDATFLNALSIYQGANQLPQGGLNEATLRNLGVIE